ncbi:GPI mannosyltransferase 1 [Dimargaris xerosporica]|nr:GPI mannosyltransferase 1 [Dimargaris xerosporica]
MAAPETSTPEAPPASESDDSDTLRLTTTTSSHTEQLPLPVAAPDAASQDRPLPFPSPPRTHHSDRSPPRALPLQELHQPFGAPTHLPPLVSPWSTALEYIVHSPDVIEFTVRNPQSLFSLWDGVLVLVLALLAQPTWSLGPISWYSLGYTSLALGWLWQKLTMVRQESLLVMRDIGLQLTATSSCGSPTVQFIAKADVDDIVINEAISMLAIKTYLAVLVANRDNLVVIFAKGYDL